HYSAAPTLSAVHRAVKECVNGLVVVGRPCQVLALRKMQGLKGTTGYLPDGDKVEFIIGLFCFWSLETGIYDLLNRKAGSHILKVEISQNFLTIIQESGSTDIPLDEVRPFIRPACQLCFDPTSEFADVSVGSTEYDSRWNTLIVRTARGKEIVDAARAGGIIETRAYPEERLPLLYRAVRNKKLRVLHALELGQGAGYLQLSDQYRAGLEQERGINL
ncbi:Coenzyme F420 hydrogenase/dehydrogenase, beta subunit C-terminal domain, partial [Desulfofundulus sp.]|uniref:Coenzyme F420 hydrogenase/dehydrogenase, beta subunit C-terminal domain n=1 Tax=Desulfofundulus sp. TaxID=2282750 RepID=UPI003C795D4C